MRLKYAVLAYPHYLVSAERANKKVDAIQPCCAPSNNHRI